MLYPSLNTPAVLIDLDKLEKNIKRISRLAAEAGVRLRPHTKLHECVEIAKMQLQAGACGIEVGAVEQAEAMIAGGINDVVIAHPFFGEHKLAALSRLLEKPDAKITVVVDMLEQAEAISRVAKNRKREVPVLIKVDTGVDRYGVPPGEPTLAIASQLSKMPNLKFIGIYAHESGLNIAKGIEQGTLEVANAMAETVRLLTREGFKLEVVGVGASPTFRTMCRYLKEGRFPEITEIHPGALYVGDVTHVGEGANTLDTCALTVLTAVQSTSHSAHVVIDAGFKTFGGDSIIAKRDTPGFFWKGRPSWGVVKGRSDLWFGRSTAERGLLYYKVDAKKDIKLGDRLEIIPNNATIVVNIHSTMYGVRTGRIEKVIPVTGRETGS